MTAQETDGRTGHPLTAGNTEAQRPGRPRLGLRGRILLGLAVILMIFAALNVLVVRMEMNKARRAAVSEAADAGRLLGLAVDRLPGQTPAAAAARNPSDFRSLVRDFAAELKRRMIVVDPRGHRLADSAAELPDEAAGPEESLAVAEAMSDGKPRFFSGAGRDEWIVVPWRVKGGAVSGAVIQDYSNMVREQKTRIMANLTPLFILDGAGLILLLLAAQALSRSLTVPIRSLTRAAYLLEKGDLNEPVSVSRQDEIGLLAAAFERMRHEVRRSRLESKAVITEQRQAEEAMQDAHAEQRQQIEELKLYADEMKHLSWIGEALQKAATPEECSASLTPLVPKLFPDQSGGLFLFGASHLEVKPLSLWGDRPPGEKDLARLDLMAVRSGHSPQTLPARDGIRPAARGSASRPADTLCVPLVSKGDVLGFLYLRPSGASASAEVPPPAHVHYLAMTVADQCALTLSNLILRDRLRQQSIRDPLTGLFNRRYLDETMEREVLRAKRLNSPVGVILADIDHFKAFNDTHGHEAGDAALTLLGKLFRKSIRGSDIACRYGGEEFILILPGAGLDGSLMRAEKIRAEVEGSAFELQDKKIGRVTISVGVAAFPDMGRTSNEVFQAADAALYRAKKEGRNRVVSAQAKGRSKL